MKLNGAVFNTVHDHFLTLFPVNSFTSFSAIFWSLRSLRLHLRKRFTSKVIARAENENSRTETKKQIPNPKNRKFLFSNFKTKFQKRKNRKPIDTKTEKLNIFSAKKTKKWSEKLPALQNRKPQSPFLYVDWFVYQFISEGAESENVSIILCVGSCFFVEFVCKITEQIYEPGNQIDNPSLRELYSNRHSSESENFCALFERVIPKNPLDS